MADLAVLGLEIDSSPAVRAAADLDRLTGSAERTGRATDAIRAASGALVAALRENTTANQALTQAMTQQAVAAARAQTAMAGVETATGAATTNVVQFTGASRQAVTQIDAMGVSAQRSSMEWKALGDQAAEALKRIEAARRGFAAPLPPAPAEPPAAMPPSGGGGYMPPAPWGMASRTGYTGPRIGPSAGAQGRLEPWQIQNLAYQGTDIATSLAGGMNPLTVLMQQGGQIAPSFVGPGSASLKGALAQAGEGVTALVSRVGLLGGAAAVAATATIALVVAQQSYAGTQTALARNLSGIGRASGASAQDINDIASGATGISIRQVREFGGQLAATGQVSPEIIRGLRDTLKDYAATTGQDMPEAMGALASAFADPTRGADALNKQLGFLSATTRENIQRLDAQGDRLGAQRMLLDAYGKSLTSAADLTSGWGRVTESVLTPIANLWDRIGAGIDRASGGGTLEERMQGLRDRVASLRAGPQDDNSGPFSEYNVAGGTSEQLRDAERALAVLQRQFDARNAASKQTADNQRGLAFDATLKSISPQLEAIKQIEDRAEALRRPFRESWIDPTGAAKTAIDGLRAQVGQMREDLAAGGAQFADAIRGAQFNLRTVGYSGSARSSAQVDEDAANKRIAALRQAGNDPESEAYKNALRSIEQARQLEQEKLQRQTIIGSSAGSGTYMRGVGQVQNEAYRQAYIDAANRYGLSPDLLASQGYRESGYNPRAVSPAGAQGIAQFMPGTARGVGLTNPFDPLASIDAQGKLMRQLLDRYNGDETAALIGYNAGPRRADRFIASGRDVATLPEETREYLKAIRTPTADSMGTVRDLDANKRAAQGAAEASRIAAENYGRNGLALEASTRASQQYQEMLARGVPASDALRQALLGYSTQAEQAARSTNLIKFRSDDEFAREQLGRSASDQQAYATARGRFGDTSSAEARTVIERTRETQDLTETKGMLTDGATSFVTALRRGGDAATALSSAFGSAADKLLSKAIDSLVSTGFSALSGGGGGAGIFATIGKAFGFSEGGWTGAGGRYEPAGVVHKGEVVWSQADVARYGGPHVVDRMRLGYPGYADGGPVSWRAASAGAAANANGASAGPPVVNVINRGEPANVTETRRNPDGSIDVVLDKMESRAAGRAASGHGAWAALVPGARQLRG